MHSADPRSDAVKVVVLIDSLRRPGGGERLAVEGAIRLDPARFERTLCVTRWEERFEHEEPARSIVARLRDAGVRIVGLRRSHRLDLLAWRPLWRIMRRERIDVIHGHLFGSNVWASVLGTMARTPAVVAHEHMWAYESGGLRPVVDRHLIARFASAFVAVSNEGRRRMIEIEHIPPERVRLIPNGIPPVRAGDGAGARTELGIGPDERLVGSVGHLRPEKAYEVLIEAAAILRDTDGDVRVVIVGEGPERPRLEELVRRLGLDGRVLLIGARDDVPDLLAAFDVAVCCSDFEGGPLSVMEYMAAGLPVVASDVGGLPELIADGESGVLVPARDPTALAEAVGRLLHDGPLAAEIGNAARERIRVDHSIDAWVERLEALYARLLARRAAP